MLGAVGGEQQRLGARGDLLVGIRGEQHGADLRAERGAARLARDNHLAAERTQIVREQIHLRRLAGAVHAFERNEQSCAHRLSLSNAGICHAGACLF